MVPRGYREWQTWHCQTQFSGDFGGGTHGDVWSADVCGFNRVVSSGCEGGDTGGVNGSRGENGDGGMASLEDRNGIDVRLRAEGRVAFILQLG